jgi:hypothetical protein
MVNVNEGARQMTDHEAAAVEHAWNLSDEKRELDAKQARLKESIALRTSAYTPEEVWRNRRERGMGEE